MSVLAACHAVPFHHIPREVSRIAICTRSTPAVAEAEPVSVAGRTRLAPAVGEVMLTVETFVVPVARTTMPERLAVPPLLVSAIVPALVTVTG